MTILFVISCASRDPLKKKKKKKKGDQPQF